MAIVARSLRRQQAFKVELAELQQAAFNFQLVNSLHKAGNTCSWLQKHHLSLDDFEELAYNNAISDLTLRRSGGY